MRRIEQPPAVHVLVCVNARDAASTGMPCCAAGNGQELYDRLHSETMRRGLLRRVFVSRSLCLAFCHADGVTVAIHPSRVWLQGCKPDDAARIFSEHIEPLVTDDAG
ncbi:MAG: ferredoxin [Planctomycetota bacterium]